MKKTTQRTTLYTEQEKEFLEATLKLLDVDFTKRIGGDLELATVYEFNCTDNESRAVLAMMRANFERNYA